jgi:hypothetical protein
MRGWGQCLSRVTRLGKFSPTLKNFWQKIGVFLKYRCYDQHFSKFSFVLSQKRQFFSGKIAENCDHNIDLWSPWLEGKLMTSKCAKRRFQRVAGEIQQNVIKQTPLKIKFQIGFIL